MPETVSQTPGRSPNQGPLAAPPATELPPVTDLRSAAAHIEGLLDLGDAPIVDDTESPDADSTPEDTASEETPTSGDDTTDENEPTTDEPDEGSEPAIVPPSSWTTEEKERFRELPPDLQAIVSKRETERDRAVSQRMNVLAEQRKAIEQETVRINETQTHYNQTLQFLLQQTIPELREAENIPLSLAQDDPTEYVKRTAIRDGLRQRAQTMFSEMQRVQGEQQQQFIRQHHEHVEHQYGALVEMMPEFRDPEKTKAIVTDIGQTMAGYGFTPQEIAGVSDARVVRVMAEITRLQKTEQARKSAASKKTSAPAPRPLPSNASTSREDRSQNQLKEQFVRLKKSGSPRDAAAIFEHLL